MAEAVEARLGAFIARVCDAAAVDAAARASNCSPAEVRSFLDIYSGEAVVGLRLVGPLLKPGQRVLEIGSGVGLLAGFLAEEGAAITGIEPGLAGFGFMPALADAIATRVRPPGPDALALSVTDLEPERHGRFDLIYSTNVLEHVIEIEKAFAAMAGVLAPQGSMVHLCPNYAVPYEPHLSIPLVPALPRATRHLFPSRISRQREVWDGLNFITARQVRRLASANGLDVTFDRGVMADFIRRLDTDPRYSDRHRSWIGRMARRLNRMGALGLIERWPAALATPMILRLRMPGATPSEPTST